MSGFFFAAGKSTLFRIRRYPGEFGEFGLRKAALLSKLTEACREATE